MLKIGDVVEFVCVSGKFRVTAASKDFVLLYRRYTERILRPGTTEVIKSFRRPYFVIIDRIIPFEPHIYLDCEYDIDDLRPGRAGLLQTLSTGSFVDFMVQMAINPAVAIKGVAATALKWKRKGFNKIVEVNNHCVGWNFEC